MRGRCGSGLTAGDGFDGGCDDEPGSASWNLERTGGRFLGSAKRYPKLETLWDTKAA
jgi:hypothetical protein